MQRRVLSVLSAVDIGELFVISIFNLPLFYLSRWSFIVNSLFLITLLGPSGCVGDTSTSWRINTKYWMTKVSQSIVMDCSKEYLI